MAEETESPCLVEDGLFGGSKCDCNMKLDYFTAIRILGSGGNDQTMDLLKGIHWLLMPELFDLSSLNS